MGIRKAIMQAAFINEEALKVGLNTRNDEEHETKLKYDRNVGGQANKIIASKLLSQRIAS